MTIKMVTRIFNFHVKSYSHVIYISESLILDKYVSLSAKYTYINSKKNSTDSLLIVGIVSYESWCRCWWKLLWCCLFIIYTWQVNGNDL